MTDNTREHARAERVARAHLREHIEDIERWWLTFGRALAWTTEGAAMAAPVVALAWWGMR